MIQHLRAKNLRALKQVDLFDLGQLNVICGKNNSGKTTLLEALTKPDSGMAGFTFDSLKCKALVKGLSNAQLVQAGNGSIIEHLQMTLGTELSKLGPVCLDDFLRVSTAVEEVWQKANIRAYARYDPKQTKDAFESILPKLRPLLLRPKRRENLNASATAGLPDQDGNGVLAKLSLAKNQLPGSTDNEKWLRLQNAFSFISEGFNAEIRHPEPNQIWLYFKSGNGDWYPGWECGLGLNELFTILYYAIFPDDELILIEEPENHIHPDMQRRLATFLKSISSKQFILSTHSSVFLDPTIADRIFMTKLQEGEIKVSDAAGKTAVLEELGYSIAENLTSDLIILVEGPYDRPIVDWLMNVEGLSQRYYIRSVTLGGDAMVHTDLEVFKQHFKVMALVDRDPGSSRARNKFIARCSEARVPCHQTVRRTIENYLPVAALRSVFPEYPAEITAIDPQQPIKNQIGFEVKHQNAKTVQLMTHADIEGTDLLKFVDMVRETLDS